MDNLLANWIQGLTLVIALEPPLWLALSYSTASFTSEKHYLFCCVLTKQDSKPETFNFGGYALMNRAQYLYLVGQELTQVRQEMVIASHALTATKQGIPYPGPKALNKRFSIY